MPRSKNPREYSLYLLNLLQDLATKAPPVYHIPLPSLHYAQSIRRELYALKAALKLHIDRMRDKKVLSDRERKDLEDFEKALHTFNVYQLCIKPKEPFGSRKDTHILEFVCRDETPLMLVLAEALTEASTADKALPNVGYAPEAAGTSTPKTSIPPQYMKELIQIHKEYALQQRAEFLNTLPPDTSTEPEANIDTFSLEEIQWPSPTDTQEP